MPKTTTQEKLEGCPGHRKLNGLEPKPKKKIPTAPKHMNTDAKKGYRELSKLVGPDGMNIMTSTDGLSLSLICDAFAEYVELKKLLKTKGRYSENKGLIKRHPAITDMQDAWRRIFLGLGKFGLTPYDRKNVNILEPKKEKSREDKIKEHRQAALKKARKAAKDGNHIKKVS